MNVRSFVFMIFGFTGAVAAEQPDRFPVAAGFVPIVGRRTHLMASVGHNGDQNEERLA